MKLKLHTTKQFIKQWLLIVGRYSFIPVCYKAKPVIIIMFDNSMQHGGLLDRLKGIISAKVIAEELGCGFHIYADEASFNLFRFLKPCSSAVPIQKKDLLYNIWHSRPVVFYNVFDKNKAAILRLFQRRQQQYHFYCNVDLVKHFYPALSQDALKEKWRWHFHQLFSFNEYFDSLLWQLGLNSETIGIHLRFQSLLGDATEDALVLDEASGLQLTEKCITAIAEIVDKHEGANCLIVSDSAVFLNRLRQRKDRLFANVIIPDGTIGHIDVVQSEIVLQKAFTDFYLLFKCAAVYQVLAPGMYNSQFSRYAAILGNAPYHLTMI